MSFPSPASDYVGGKDTRKDDFYVLQSRCIVGDFASFLLQVLSQKSCC